MKQSKPLRLLILFLVILFVALPRLVLALQVGEKAPDFELDSSKGGKLKLSSLKGKNVLDQLLRSRLQPDLNQGSPGVRFGQLCAIPGRKH